MSGVWGTGEGKNRGKPSPRKICGEAASNPRPGDSVRQLSPLHQACPSSYVSHAYNILVYDHRKIPNALPFLPLLRRDCRFLFSLFFLSTSATACVASCNPDFRLRMFDQAKIVQGSSSIN